MILSRMAEIKRIWIEWTSNNFVDALYFLFSFVFHLGKGLFARPREERSLWWWKYYISHWGQGEGDLIKPLGSDNLSLLATLFYYVLDWRTFGSRISNSHTDKSWNVWKDEEECCFWVWSQIKAFNIRYIGTSYAFT